MDFNGAMSHLLQIDNDEKTEEAVYIVAGRFAQVDQVLKYPDIDDPQWVLDQVKKIFEL